MPALSPKEALRPATKAVHGVYPSSARPAAPWEAHRAPDDYGVPASPDWRDVEWPSCVRQAEVGGRELTYVDLGEGDEPPMVFVHGLGGNWQNWLECLPRAAQERRAIALDLPGFGISGMPDEDISISFYASVLDELLEGLGIESAVVVGNSMGGFIGAELAIKYATRVERLVLASAAGISSTTRARRPTMTMFRIAGVVSSMALSRSRDVVVRPRLRHAVLSSVIRHPSRLCPDVLLEIMPGSNAPAFMPALDALLDYDFTNSVPEIRCPTLMIWGREDMIVPVGDADEFERLIPDSRKVIFDETGHVPMLERPRSFNDCVMEFAREGKVSAAEPSDGQGARRSPEVASA